MAGAAGRGLGCGTQGGLAGFHCFLICNGKTSREQLKANSGVPPPPPPPLVPILTSHPLPM